MSNENVLQRSKEETLLKLTILDSGLTHVAYVSAHRWLHTRPFTCDICQARFPTKGGLISKYIFYSKV